MSTISLRNAQAEDLETIVAFNMSLASETEECALDYDTVRAGVAAVLSNENLGTYYMAESEGEVVGQLMITLEWSDWRNGFFHWIQSVYVPPEFRCKGVFRALYDHVIERAKTAPRVCGVRLYVERENTKAREVYDRVGMLSGGYDLREIDWGRPGD
jgi:GNAT superfamily N-acetyltransferase